MSQRKNFVSAYLVGVEMKQEDGQRNFLYVFSELDT